MPAPDGIENYSKICVIYADESGQVTVCESTVNPDGSISFFTDHFSVYALVGIPTYTPGDVDENGEVEISDAIYLLYHVNFEEDYPVHQAVDFDGNGKLEISDAIYLLYHVNFEEDYPLY